MEPSSIVFMSYFKTTLAMLFYLANLFLNAVVTAVLHDRVTISAPPMYDLMLSRVPSWPLASYVIELFIIILNLSLLIGIFAHRLGYRILQRYCIVAGIVYFIRALVIAVTQFPVINPRFVYTPKTNSNATLNEYFGEIVHRSLCIASTLGFRLFKMQRYFVVFGVSGYMINLILGMLLFPTHCYIVSNLPFCSVLFPTDLLYSRGQRKNCLSKIVETCRLFMFRLGFCRNLSNSGHARTLCGGYSICILLLHTNLLHLSHHLQLEVIAKQQWHFSKILVVATDGLLWNWCTRSIGRNA